MSTNQNETTKAPIVNCHAHVFTGDHVPPFLGKTLIWWPFYLVLYTPAIMAVLKRYFRYRENAKYVPWSRSARITRWFENFQFKIGNNVVLRWMGYLVGGWLTLTSFYIIFRWVALLLGEPEIAVSEFITNVFQWLLQHYLCLPIDNGWLQVGVILLLFLFVRRGRRLVFMTIQLLWSSVMVLPGKGTKDLLQRYLQLARYSSYASQGAIKGKLKAQYPPGTGQVLLSMDMKYMGAGRLPKTGDYYKQLDELHDMMQTEQEATLYPFMFIDPRRMLEEPEFFRYEVKAGKVELLNCEVKDYIEGSRFAGFKIYPALGYYPFDEALLPLWKYAADNGIPIMSHCIRGVIFYRGRKKKEWNYHPVIQELTSNNAYTLLPLSDRKNMDFTINFTHPVNVACLLKEPLLRMLVATAGKPVKALFGYSDDETPLANNLAHLKYCFAHFGGEDEWRHHLEADRDAYSQQLVKNPEQGIDLLHDVEGKFSWSKLEHMWKYVDWYSIICSLMVQHQHVYADISYMLHNNTILPQLQWTLSAQQQKLRKKVLYGTDFYVVRNHKSDRQLLMEMMGGLSEEEFDLIARENPKNYLMRQ